MIVQILSGANSDDLNLDKLKDILGDDFKTIFPAKEIASIYIPYIYKEAINDLKYVE